jgi:hypothetical protein
VLTSVCVTVPGFVEEIVYEFVVVELSNKQGYISVLVGENVDVLFTVTAKYNAYYISRNYTGIYHLFTLFYVHHISFLLA